MKALTSECSTPVPVNAVLPCRLITILAYQYEFFVV